MSLKESFINDINKGYISKGESIIIGGAEALPNAPIKTPLKPLNRHGLIAAATGTGKTKTIQVLSEQLSSFGIPVLMIDIKGDFSGIAKKGQEKSFIIEHHTKINIAYKIASFLVELMRCPNKAAFGFVQLFLYLVPYSFQEFSI